MVQDMSGAKDAPPDVEPPDGPDMHMQPDHTDAPVLCGQNERVQERACVACAVGFINDAGDDASGEDTQCAPLLCARNERVRAHACVSCAAGTTNAAGDDASGADTRCDDACSLALGVTCAQFNQAYIKASNPDVMDQFGHALALDGDTLAVGAEREGSSATGINGDQSNNAAPLSGAVYIFTRSGREWTQQAYIKASNAESGDRFGAAVALDGDTLVVGAYGEGSAVAAGIKGSQADNSAPKSGAAYIFTRTGESWKQVQMIKASNGESKDGFGHQLALDGSTLAVAAYNESSKSSGINGDQADNAAPFSGAVYIFTRQGQQWSQQAYIKASNPDAFDNFGHKLVLEADTLAVSANQEASNTTGVSKGDQDDNSAPNSGAVYVFTRAQDTWTQQAYLKPPHSTRGAFFGQSLALDGRTLAVGAIGDHRAAPSLDQRAMASGAVHVFTRKGPAWSQQAYIKASIPRPHSHFGGSLALDKDALVVSAGNSSKAAGVNGNPLDNTAPESGAAYVFARRGSTWTQRAFIKASNPNARDWFGLSLALDGHTLVVGAVGEASKATEVNGDQRDNSVPSSGAVYVRRLAP